jgi:GntR family transcriptional regulator, galactonate operon transcriptional repressor
MKRFTSPFGPPPARKRNLFAHVVEELGTRIMRGDLQPDLPFPKEADLGQEFGASRSVIREAVKALAAKGLVESRTGTGIRVLAPIHWNLLDAQVLGWRYQVMPRAQFFRELFEIRLMIEPRASALAATRATPAEIAEISDAYKAMAAERKPEETAVDEDLHFHRAILSAGHNALLLQMGNLIGVGLFISHQLSRESFNVFLPMHKKVLDSIAARAPIEAEDAMRRLLTETYEFMAQHLPEQAGPPEALLPS